MFFRNFFFVFILLLQLGNAATSTVSSGGLKLPGLFVDHIVQIEQDEVFEKYLSTRKINILIAPAQNSLNTLLSGIRPIMSSKQKEEIRSSLAEKLKIGAKILDIFDIALKENSKRVTDAILEYSEAYQTYESINGLIKQSVSALRQPGPVSKMKASTTNISKIWGDEAGDLVGALSNMCAKQNKENLAALQQKWEEQKSKLGEKLSEFQSSANDAVRQYLDSLGTYCESLRSLRHAQVDEALKVLEELQKNPPEKLMAYIIAEIGTGLGDLRPLVKLLHTEPMLVSSCLSDSSNLRPSFFYTRKDMCGSCRVIINEFFKANPIIVLSQDQTKLEGDQGADTTVDWILTPDLTLIREGEQPNNTLTNVFQIRIQILPQSGSRDYREIMLNIDKNTATLSSTAMLAGSDLEAGSVAAAVAASSSGSSPSLIAQRAHPTGKADESKESAKADGDEPSPTGGLSKKDEEMPASATDPQ